MIIVRDSFREEHDFAVYNMQNQAFPKKLSIKNGTSNVYQLNNELFMKLIVNDYNSSAHPQYFGAHHSVITEDHDSFDDYAEVLFYRLARNLGTKQKTDNFGNVLTVPVVDSAEYRLATYIDKQGYSHKGCVSRNIAGPGDVLIKGRDLLMPFKDPTRPNQEVRNSLSNHLAAVKLYIDKQNSLPIGPMVIADKNIELDLLTDAYMSYRVSNSDNHSNNIIYVQRTLPDGTRVISVGSMIDNGASWEMMAGNCLDVYRNIIAKNTNENGEFVLTDSPFKHQAFHLDTTNLNGCKTTINGHDLQQEFEFAAHALAKPEFYDSVYRIEQGFDLRRVYAEMAIDYRAKFPEEITALTIADSELKGHLMTQVMANYFCYTAYKTCVGEINEENPSELYLAFQQKMGELPLQPNIDGYMNAFREIAKENEISLDEEKLTNLDFLPQSDLSQTDDCAQ